MPRPNRKICAFRKLPNGYEVVGFVILVVLGINGKA